MFASSTAPVAQAQAPAKPGATAARYGLVAVLALGALAYANALNAFWVGDDFNYVVPKTLDTVLNFANPVGRAQFRPLGWISWVIDYTLYGPIPLGWHLTSLALHLANTLLIVLLLRRLARRWWPADSTARTWVPLVAGAFFAVHPAHPEAVTWISARFDLLAGLGTFLACWAFVHWREGGPRGFYILTWLAIWWAMMSKESGLLVPLALLLIDLALGTVQGRRLWAPGELGAVLRTAGGVVLRAGLALLAMSALLALLGRDGGRALPLVVLLAGLPFPPPRPRPEPAHVGWLLSLGCVHAPFLGMAAAYGGLRLGMALTGQGRLMYGAETHLQFGPGTLLDSAAGYLLIGLGAWDAPAWVAGWPAVGKLALLLAALLLAGYAVRRLGRPALFAALWVPATALLTFDGATDRWFYIPSFGFCLLAAELLYLAGRARPLLRTVPAAALILLWLGLTLAANTRWVESGEVARSLIQQIRAFHPDLPRPATFYLANPPYSYNGILLFNTGFQVAPNFAYQDYRTIHTYIVDPPAPLPADLGPHPVFLRYEAGRMVEYPTLAALVAAQTAPTP
jgi:hypothetical protein